MTTRWIGRRGFTRGGAAAGLMAASPWRAGPHTTAAHAIEGYIYPNPYRYPDRRVMNSPQTVSIAQATAEIPQTDRLAGVAVIVYWSDVEASPGHYDFSRVQAILEFWKQRGKSVILDVATIGYPMRAASGIGVQSATPQWLLDRIATYKYPARILGFAERGTPPAVFPDFRDAAFASAIGRLAQATSRLDGHPALAQIRIPTGLMGEDNPLVGPVIHPLPWYTDALWLRFCESILRIYSAAFRKTQLEFDIGRLAWAYARGSAADRAAIMQFNTSLLERGVLLAFNGLSAQAEPLLSAAGPSSNGVAQGLEFLKDYARRGGDTGLEAASPLAAPRMADVGEIVRTIRAIGPKRLVLFNDFIAGFAPGSPQWQVYARAYGPRLSAQVEANAKALLRLM